MKSKAITKNTFLILLLSVFFIGIIVRASFFIGNKFPLHDGGFFYVLIKDLLNNNLTLPEFSSYNNAGIPFIYPPFGIYLSAIIEKMTGIDRLQLLMWIPLFFSILTLPAFSLLSQELLKDKWTTLASTACYSLLPLSYGWLILGGGVTRSPGAFFGILALTFVVRYINSDVWRDGLFSSVFCGLTVLSHPEWAWFIFYSIATFIIIRIIQRDRKVISRSCWILGGTLLVVSPWIITMLHLHGTKLFQPLLDSGFSRWIDISSLLFFGWSKEVFFPFITLFALISLLLVRKHKKWFLVIWFIVIFLFQGRAADQKVVVPLALLAGMGIKMAMDFVISTYPKMFSKTPILIGTFLIFIYTLGGSIAYCNNFVFSLSAQEVTSIYWIQQHLPRYSKILVISGKDWPADSYSEWMAALAGNESITLVQGYEWLSGFSNRIASYKQVQDEYNKGMEDLITWLNQKDINVDYLILLKENPENIGNSSPILHWKDAILYPGVKMKYADSGIVLLDLKELINK